VYHSRGTASASLFAVKHYAGTVEYSAEGLTEANGDPALRGYVPPAVRDLLASSTRGDIFQVNEVTTNLQLVSHFAILCTVLANTCMHDYSTEGHCKVLQCMYATTARTATACISMAASTIPVTSAAAARTAVAQRTLLVLSTAIFY
jgi:hypothetical protein